MSRFILKNYRSNSPKTVARRRGAVVIYVALGMIVFLGISAIVVDLGFAYRRQADVQKACDNAALAGAGRLSQSYTNADLVARDYAAENGYTSGVRGASVSTSQPTPKTFRVTISAPQTVFFAGILGHKSLTVRASALAEYESFAGLNFSNNGNASSVSAAFVNNGPYALGPKGSYSTNSYGDYFSALYKNDGSGQNERYDSNGYNFLIKIPSNFKTKPNSNSGDDHSKFWVEVFDPDSNGSYDEVHSPSSQVRNLVKNTYGFTPTDLNKTTYNLIYEVVNSQGAVTSSSQIDTITYDPASSNYNRNNGKWTQGELEINLNNNYDLVNGRFRLQVKSIDGASENGFYVRTGPKYNTSINDATWESRYGEGKSSNGSTFAADGRVSFNFWKAGTAQVDLGYVPQSARNGKLEIVYYDLEGGNNLKVFCDSSSSGLPSGGQNVAFQKKDGVEGVYSLTVPPNYTGGNWRVEYTAGQNDSSSWQIKYPGPGRMSLRLID